MTKEIITQERLKELLRYDPDTGDFTRLVSTARCIKVGDIAGSLNQQGYIQIRVGGRKCQAHRLAFLYMTGKFPVDQTDHINHIRNDNRWGNLREADNSLNQRNASMRSDNTSGCVGVHLYKEKWMASIRINGKLKYLGHFTKKIDAIGARKTAEIDCGFHPNHGKY